MPSKKKKGPKTKASSPTNATLERGVINPTESSATEAEDPKTDIRVELFDSVLQEDLANVTSYSNVFVGAIDQGTSSTRFLLFTAQTGRIAASAQMEHVQYYPHSGWHEHDPWSLWHNTVTCMAAVTQRLDTLSSSSLHLTNGNISLNKDTMAAIGITNQRETIVAWNRVTGQPYYPAIVWDDMRTSDIAAQLSLSEMASRLTTVTGLPISSYFAGTKVKWLLDNVDALRADVAERPETVCFGTIDTWLLFQLTGTTEGSSGPLYNTGGVFRTDVTNASRWLFMALDSCTWDATCIATVCAPHTLPLCTLPMICPSAYYHATDDTVDGPNDATCFGVIHPLCGAGMPAALAGVPITAMMGDQQAALFGQAAHTAGHAKNTYGTGLFLMMNTGTVAVPSTHGLLTTVAYQIGSHGAVHYALEGSVSHSGATIQWLRDQLGIITVASESEALAATTDSNDGLYFCPAFSGLFAPRWRSDARACIVGMTASHHKGHVCRAALEAAAYQTKEVFDAIIQDSGIVLQSLKVDGGGTHNKLLMQFQADMINVPVVKPLVMETTAMGAAFGAGLAVGVWKDLDAIQMLWTVAETYQPSMCAETRAANVAGWNKAVSKSLGWIGDEDEDATDDATDPTKVSVDVASGDRTYSLVALVFTASVALVVGVTMGVLRRK